MEDLLEEVLSSILSRLSVKDLLRCKATCRGWYSLISSRRFGLQHAEREKYCPVIIMYACNALDQLCGWSYFSFEDGRPCLKKFSWMGKSYERGYAVSGCCNGLVCLNPYSGTKVLVWNPATREIWKVRYTFLLCDSDLLILGFGYDRRSDDYKILTMQEAGEGSLYSLRSNSAKPIFHEAFPWGKAKKCLANPCGVYLEGRLHWSLLNPDDSLVCFDLEDEGFLQTLLLPKSIPAAPTWLSLGVVKGCLCMYLHIDGHACEVWIMKEYSIRSSWTRLHRSDYLSPLELRPVVAMLDGKVFFYNEDIQRFLYNEDTQCFTIYDPTEDTMSPGAAYSEDLLGNWVFSFPWAFKESVISPRALFSAEDSSHMKQLSGVPDLSRFKRTSAVKILLDGTPDKRIVDCDSLVNDQWTAHRVSWMGKSYSDHAVVGSCNGIVLLERYGKPECLWLWNPSTREVRKIRDVVSRLHDGNITYGFGYDTSSDEYKILMIHCLDSSWTAHLWCLKSDTWKTIPTPTPADKTLSHVRGVHLNGVLHWSALTADGSIMCFDLHEEIFPKTLLLPETTMMEGESLKVGIIGDCLGICMTDNRVLYEVWMMKEYGMRSSWTLVFRREGLPVPSTPLAVTGDGKIILDDGDEGFHVYDPTQGRLSPHKVYSDNLYCCHPWIYQETSVSPYTLLESG